jgi:hypothetical protein
MSCISALNNFAARDFTNWTGLPESCSLADVSQQFRLLDDGVGLVRLGDTKREFRMFAVPGYEHPVRIWSDGQKVLMLDVEYPSFVLETPALLKELGDPETKLDYDWGTTRLENSEWVYADRGLALFLAPDNSRAFHLAVFSRTTMQGYKENFQLHLGKRLFPKR